MEKSHRPPFHGVVQLLSSEQTAAESDERARKAVDALHAFQAGAGMEKTELLDTIKLKEVGVDR